MGINENLQPVTWAVSMPFVVITSLSCILRVYSRLCLSKSFGADDWFMVAASITWLATQAILGQMIVFGGGKQDKDVPPENLLKIVTTLAVLLFYGLQCLPLDAFFHPEAHPDAKCIPTAVTLYFPASMNVLTDLLIYILPIYPLWTLQMSARRRVGLIVCFTVGGSTIIVSLLRFIVLVQLASGSRTFYVYGSVAIVTTIELCTAIMTANMPSLRSVWRTHVSGTLYGSSGRKPSSYELGTTSRARGNRKMIKSSIVQRLKQGATNVSHADSEEELCRNGGDIVVSTQVNVSSVADPSVNSPQLPPSYYKPR